jgi:alkane 1-monooxygenase
MNVKKIAYLLPHIFALLVLCGYLFTMPLTFFVVATIYTLILLPLLDIVGSKVNAIDPSEITGLRVNRGRVEYNYYLFNILTFLPLHFLCLGYGLYFIAYMEPTYVWFLYAILVGITGAMTLNLCHELMHTRYLSEKYLSRLCAAIQFWGAHEYEHLYIHHDPKKSCTEHDKSYAMLNQSIYSFISHGWIANYIDAWKIEKSILQGKNKSEYNIFYNAFLQTVILSITVAILVALFLGFLALLFFMVQAAISIIIFLSTTYNQHYGLTRRKNENGEYEPFTSFNTWSSNTYASNGFFWSLTLHSHHHVNPLCRYQHLKLLKNSPILPFGYFTCLYVSFIPPLWYRIMNPLVEKNFIEREIAESALK